MILENRTLDLSDENYERLITLLYRTLEDDARWREFLSQVCLSVGGDFIHILGSDNRLGTISYSNGCYPSGEDFPAIAELDLLQKYRLVDPRLPYIYGNTMLRWTRDHEHFSDAFMDEDPFYRDFLGAWNLRYISMCKVVDNEQATILFGILTSPQYGPLREPALAFLNRLLPHISHVYQLGIEKYIYSTQALVGHALVNKFRQPVILCSVTGQVVHINQAAEQLLQTTQLVQIAHGQLRLVPPFQQELLNEFAKMEAAIQYNDKGETASLYQSLTIHDPNQADTLYTFYNMLQPERMLGTFGLRPLVMLFFYHPESAPSIDPALLTAAFNLTPAECRIAILLGDGLSQKEIAHTLGIRPDTVRKQLQVIYHKTATKQQSELIRLMLHLPSNFVQQPIKPALPPA